MADFVYVFRANFARNRSVLRWSDQRFKSFSNRGRHLLFQQQYAPEWTNGKAFNIMASAQFFATYITYPC